MRLASAFWNLLFLYASLLLLIVSARKTTIGFKNAYNIKKFHDHQDHDQSHDHHMISPELNVFFTPNDFQIGKTMPVYFPEKNLSSSPKLLTKEEADSIPFSLSQLQYLLDYFSFPKNSPQAQAMEYTLRQCELGPTKGEARFCATSLESMLDFALDFFGSNTRIKVLTTTHLKDKNTLFQNYTISEKPREVLTPRMIGCHTMPYPYLVFYCHGQLQSGENKVFEISLAGENGERVESTAVCHMDTSHWDRNHVSFRVLGIEPGSSP
ncbi:hypothetical protein TIFTF001_051083, partial [Ficus carica]